MEPNQNLDPLAALNMERKEETERGLCIPHLILRSYRTYA